jgi:hypothetical protein
VSGRAFEFRRDLFQYRLERIGASNPDFVGARGEHQGGCQPAAAILLGVIGLMALLPN